MQCGPFAGNARFRKKQADRFEKHWSGKCFWSFGTGRSARVAVLFSSNFCGKIVRFLFDSDGRILSLLINFNNSMLNIVNIYSPCSASDRKAFFSCLHEYFISQGELIIGGYFNCIDNVLDKLNCSIVPSSDKKSLCSLLTDFSLVDVWRKQNPSWILFTWFNSDFTQASRIDRFLIARTLVSKVFSCEFLPCALSDHDFAHLGLSLDGSTKHTGIWKFNNSLLANPDFKTVLSEAIAVFKLQIPNF